MTTKSIPLGPRLGLIFAEIGDKLNAVPDEAQREVNQLLDYVEGRTMIEKLVGFLVSQVPMPEPVGEPEPIDDTVLQDPGRELDTSGILLDDDDDTGDDAAGDTEPQKPETSADAPASETAPTPPPAPPKPKRSRAKAKATSPTVAG